MVGWALNSSHSYISLGVGKAAAEPLYNLHSSHGVLSLRQIDTIVGEKAMVTGTGEVMATRDGETPATVGGEAMATVGGEAMTTMGGKSLFSSLVNLHTCPHSKVQSPVSPRQSPYINIDPLQGCNQITG